MKLMLFKEHSIVRSSPPEYKDYKNYREHLENDFRHRCAYCNLLDSRITTPFEIDHFVPKKAFEGIWDELVNTYENLMYSCKKCNNAKRAQFSGEIHPPDIKNELFYNPTVVDYNDVFFRNEYGAINSDDEKGLDMIIRLHLYRPIHSLAWICEILFELESTLKRAIEKEVLKERKDKLKEAHYKICEYYIELSQLFISSYNDKKLKLFDFQD